jgi:hypothetical protein
VPDINVSNIGESQNVSIALKRNYQIIDKEYNIDLDFSSTPVKKQKKD